MHVQPTHFPPRRLPGQRFQPTHFPPRRLPGQRFLARTLAPGRLLVRIRRLALVAVTVVVAVAAAGLAATAVGAAIRHGHPDAEEHEEVTGNPLSSTGSCGVERWSVKTGTDADN